MDKKLMTMRLAEDIRRNSEFKETLEYFTLAINTPEKSDANIHYLRGIKHDHFAARPSVIALTMLAASFGLTEPSLKNAQLRDALADLCRHLGSPDNCRIALCTIHHTLRDSFDLILERDAGTVDYCFMWAIRRCINTIVEALAAAKLSVAEAKED